jgi:hypothetical protein
VVAAIAPICVDQFQRSADAGNNLTALKKISTWGQAMFRLKRAAGRDDAWQQGGRFRRAASLRRYAQQLEVSYER